ncbi:MAG TPA: hypothetical protein VLJ15_00440 [Gammaproteobacteria bacterium]|nr:hypothetical protein [Gammaproteobacteria bacterium]
MPKKTLPPNPDPLALEESGVSPDSWPRGAEGQPKSILKKSKELSTPLQEEKKKEKTVHFKEIASKKEYEKKDEITDSRAHRARDMNQNKIEDVGNWAKGIAKQTEIDVLEENGRWMIHEIKPEKRLELLQKLSVLFDGALQAEIAHANGIMSKDDLESHLDALRAFVNDILKNECVNKENEDYWKEKKTELRCKINDNNPTLSNLAGKVFDLNNKIKKLQLGGIFNAFKTDFIIRILDKAVAYQDDPSLKELFEYQIARLEKRKKQLESAFKAWNDTNEYINKLVDLAPGGEKNKSVIRAMYEAPLRYFSHRKELIQYADALKKELAESVQKLEDEKLKQKKASEIKQENQNPNPSPSPDPKKSTAADQWFKFFSVSELKTPDPFPQQPPKPTQGKKPG